MHRKHELFRTVVGSHMWDMQRPESDVDYFSVFAYSTNLFLMGYHPKLSFFEHTNKFDIHQHEIEKVISQLMSGNINFIFGVMSPIIVKSSIYHKELRGILLKYPPKNAYNSIRGLAIHNYKIYIEKGRDPSERRMNKILRVLQFGITMLRTGKYEFKPYYGGTPNKVLEMIKALDKAYKESTLVEAIPEDILRDLLYKVRKYFETEKLIH